MTLPYSDIYSILLSKITDYSFLQYDESTINELMRGWLRSAVSKPYVRGKFKTLSFDDIGENIEFTLNNPVDDESDEYFVSEALALGMLISWLEPMVNNITLIAQMVGTSSERFFSQQQHLHEIRDLLSSTEIKLRKMLRDYGYQHNSYISEA